MLSPAQRTYLDLVRATAAMFVLVDHASSYFLVRSNRIPHDGYVVFGSFGVLTFFFLSGFLISLSVFTKGNTPGYGFPEYFIDRFCRIYCSFIPALVFVFAVDSMVVDDPGYEVPGNFNVGTWIGNLFMLQEFPPFQVARRLGVPDSPWFIQSFGTGRPFWTICIEWWIYMMFGMVVLLLLRGHRLGILGGLALAFVSITPVYYILGGTGQCLGLLWIMGIGCSWLLLSGQPRIGKSHYKLIAIGGVAAMIGRVFANRGEVVELQFALFMVITLYSLMMVCRDLAVPTWVRKVIGFSADYSYSLYLTHNTVVSYLAVKYPTKNHSPGLFIASIILSNIAAVAMWWLFERHHRAAAAYLKSRMLAPNPKPVET